jgi:uncharacterized membrane protein YdbT with pleckstrin-like domain
MSTPKDQFIEGAKNSNEEEEVEEDLWSGGYSGKAMVGNWILGGIITIGLIAGMFVNPIIGLAIPLLWICLLGLLGFRKFNVHYELTTQRFIHKTGILKRATDRIEVIDIDDVTFVQGIVERMLGVGTIKISSSDRSHPELTMLGIDQVSDIADMIDDIRRKERRKRGLHIEAI